jgi:hypothetical protein
MPRCNSAVKRVTLGLFASLFGPTSPALWGPPPDRPWHHALWAGGRGDPHGQLPDPGLLAIEVDQVTAVLADLPPAAAPRPAGAGIGAPLVAAIIWVPGS